MPGLARKNYRIRKEINEWKKIWECLKGFLRDAEKKQFSNDGVRVWLQDLEHLAYDAEDILQNFNYHILKSQIETQNQAKLTSLRKFSNFIGCKIPEKSPKIDSMTKNDLKRITNKLYDLVKTKEFLNLLEISSNDQNYTNHGPSRDPSGSSPTDRLYGREDEKRSLIDLLLRQKEGVSIIEVIPIVGMGGIGKTTLVQHVYTDQSVDSYFDTKVWICVSKHYNRLRIMRGIMQAVLSAKLFDYQDLSLIEEKVRNALRNKKLLLVLDDFWNNNYRKWLNLCAPLLAAAPGSKIIVTTRITAIADSIKTIDQYKSLSYLSEENCWLLFCELARLNPIEKSKCVEIGREIVKKCSKLPRAVMTMGGILRSKTQEEQWECILSSKLWTGDNEVMPVLRMSYNDLSSELKRCFSIYTIFPEDYQFSEQEVVQLRMGVGLISYDGISENDLSIENRGRDLFRDLVSKCLILKEMKRYSDSHNRLSLIFGEEGNGDNDFYVMHNLMRELAQQISGTTCCSLVQLSTLTVESAERSRYLSFSFSILSRMTKNLKDLNMPLKLRTFTAIGEEFDKICGIKKDLNFLFTKMRCLRVLSLRGYGDSELLESIAFLKLLRYLDLSGSLLRKLPNSVTFLYNLEFLNLSCCKHLNELPSDNWRLINLWSLDISKTGIEKELPKAKKVAKVDLFHCWWKKWIVVDSIRRHEFSQR